MKTPKTKKKLRRFFDEPQQRAFKISARKRSIDEKRRTVELAFSSDEPYQRWFGEEVLGHETDEVDLSRLEDGTAAVLVNHSFDDHVGVVESVSVSGGKGRAVVRFGGGARASEVFDDIVDGIRCQVSVGYVVSAMKLIEERDDAPDVYRVTSWQPYEISIVSVAADPTVGVGRSRISNEFTRADGPKGKPMGKQKRPSGVSRSQWNEMGPSERQQVIDEQDPGSEVQAIAAAGKAYGAADIAMDVIRNGGTIHDFNERVLESRNFQANTADDPSTIGMSRQEIADYSFVNALMAAAYPDNEDIKRSCGLEIEASRAVRSDRIEGKPTAITIPFDVLAAESARRDIVVGTPAAGGYLVGTEHRGNSFVELLQAATIVDAMGVTTLSGLTQNIAIPRQTGGSAVTWVPENGTVGESSATFDQILLTPKSCGTYSEISRLSKLQSNPATEEFVRNDFIRTIAREIDRVAVEGTGSNDEPTGILSTSGVGAVEAGDPDGGSLSYELAVDMESAISTSNAALGKLNYLTNAAVVGAAKKVKLDNGSGRFLIEGAVSNGQRMLEMNGYGVHMSNTMPADLTKGSGSALSSLIFGNWADLLVGLWGGIDIIADPFTLATQGITRIVIYQSIDIAIKRPESFAVMDDIITT